MKICKVCQNCAKEFVLKTNPNQRCCSKSCNATLLNKEKGERFITPKCSICGKETRRVSKAKFCSVECQRSSIRGSGNPMWKGGRSRQSEGYIYLLKKGHSMSDKYGKVLEHRFIMSEILGRPLSRVEIVHHLNGDKSDNRPENLELLSSQAEHIKKDGHINGHKYRIILQIDDSPR